MDTLHYLFSKIDAGKIFRGFMSGFAAALTYAFGGADKWLIGLIVIMIADYISGVIAAIIKHELSSRKGLAGILKKMLILCVVAVAHIVDEATGANGVLRALTIGFLMANEGISVLENCAKCGVSMPKKLLIVLEQLRDSADADKKE